MNRRDHLMGLIVLIAGTAVFSMPRAAQPNETFQNLPFETLSIGTQSGCSRPAKLVIKTEAEWKRVWNVHSSGVSSTSDVPTVAFSRQIVLAVLDGNQTAPNRSIQISQVVRGPRETLVYFYQDEDVASIAGAMSAAQPFHFAAIADPGTPIRFVNALGEACTNCGK